MPHDNAQIDLYRSISGVHPLTSALPEEALVGQVYWSDYEAAWNALGFTAHLHTDEGSIDEGGEACAATGLYLPVPPVADGWYRVAAWPNENGEVSYWDVRPVTDYARALVAWHEAHPYPEPAPPVAAGHYAPQRPVAASLAPSNG